MGTVIVGLSISLDGFVAGADDGVERLLGIGGERLFAWMGAGPEANRDQRVRRTADASVAVTDGWFAECGAIVSGRRTFDIAGGWANGHPMDVPIFVVTHDPPTEGDWSPRVTFVTDGVEHALELAQRAAGDLAVSVCAADTAQELLRAGKLDEIEVSVRPGAAQRGRPTTSEPTRSRWNRSAPSRPTASPISGTGSFADGRRQQPSPRFRRHGRLIGRRRAVRHD